MTDEKKTKKVERTLEQQAILDNIIACLKYKKIDQKDLCEYLGKSGQLFTGWNSRNTNSFMKYLPEIATFLDITVDDLLGKRVVSEASALEEKLLHYFSLCDMDGQLRIIQAAMNEFDRTVKEKTDSEAETEAG